MSLMPDDRSVMPATLLEPGDIVMELDGTLLGKVMGVYLDHDRLEVHFEGRQLPWVKDASTKVRVPNQIQDRKSVV